MINASDFRNGVTLEMDNGIWTIVSFLHVKPGKGAAFVRTKLKNIVTGAVIGLILGDLNTGLLVGGTYQLMTIGNMPIGGAQPPNAVIGGIMAAVLAIAPVAGIPPKSAEAIFPAPCAISSVSERCLLLIMPSATTQERSDSIAASTAIVNAFGIAD